MKKLIFTLAAMGLILAATEAKSAEGWIKVYLGDSDRNQVSASGSCTIITTTKDGEKTVLKAKLVTPDKSLSGGELAHGGQVITQGKNSVELVVGRPENSHGGTDGEHGQVKSEADEHNQAENGHDEGDALEHDAGANKSDESHGQEHGEASQSAKALPYFEADFDFADDNVTFSAVVIVKSDKGTFNVKGFEYPFFDYSSVVSMMEAHLDEIQSLIDSNKLLKVHSVASKISRLAKSLPIAKDFPDDNRSEIEKTCKEIIALFGEIDKAADAQKKAETVEVLGKYRSKVSFLAKHVHEDDGHED